MTNKIKGITVTIGGNTQSLDKALKGVNSQAVSLQSELRDVNRALKLDPTNTELLRQKQELLASSVTETKNKLQTLKQADAQCSEQFKKDHAEQYRALQREIVITENNLKELEAQAASSNAMVAKISASADKMAGSLENAASKTKMLSAAAGGLIAAAGGAAYKAITLSDDLNTLANQTGFTTADLQKMEYAADRIDVSMETITGASKKMKKSMVSSSKDTVAAWNAIGVAVRDNVTGELRDSTTVFYEAIEGLSKIQNETERDTLAMQLFGKSADDLAGIIDDGGAAFKQYGKEAEDAGVILSQDTLDSLNKMNDAVDELKAQTTGTFAEVGAEVATMLTPCLQDVARTIKDILQWVRNLDQGQLKFIGTILLVIAALSPMLSIQYKAFTDARALQCISELKAWLLQKSGYRRLQDNFDPTFFRMARFVGPLDIESYVLKAAEFTIVFDCKPQRYLCDGETIVTMSVAGEIYNPTAFPAAPVIRVYGTSAGTLMVGNTVVQIKSINEYVDLDCELQDAFKGITNCNGNVYAPNFPELPPGITGISFSGGITKIEIKPRWWQV